MSHKTFSALALTIALPLATLTIAALPGAARADETVMAHLASFRSQPAAERAWHILADQYSGVLYTKAQLRVVQLGAKGQWWRVYADGDQTIVRLLCDSLKQRKQYCVLHGRDSLQPTR
jgi:hypothetical protein